MVCDALLLANDHIRIPGKDGAMVKISDAIHDMVRMFLIFTVRYATIHTHAWLLVQFAYTLLTDEILTMIQLSFDPALKPAQKLLEDIACRFATTVSSFFKQAHP
jgi:hypothetical protein